MVPQTSVESRESIGPRLNPATTAALEERTACSGQPPILVHLTCKGVSADGLMAPSWVSRKGWASSS